MVCTRFNAEQLALDIGHSLESIPLLWTEQLQQLSDTFETRIFVYLSLVDSKK